jgi:endonuclease-3 related protein
VPSGQRLQPGRTGHEHSGESPIYRRPTRTQLGAIYRALLSVHGPQQWWPTALEDGPAARLEICWGAILTQNTSWRGAAAALENLHGAGVFEPHALLELPTDVLAELVRPSGHFNVKARKLQSFCSEVVEEYGGIDELLDAETDELRERLLSIWGIGPETADAITLYAAREPTFVIDAYAYRLFERLGLAPGPRKYDVYREFFLEKIGPDVNALNEWHALMVRHGQQVCRRSNPHCEECPLLRRCPFGKNEIGIREG